MQADKPMQPGEMLGVLQRGHYLKRRVDCGGLKNVMMCG